MKILVAEDDPVSRRLLQAFLARWGYEVTITEDGAEALRVLQRDDAPRLAVLDWMMPKLEGTQVCQRLRQHTGKPYVYILLLTARAQKKDLLLGLDAGVDDYLAKPFDAQELRARLRVGERILALQDSLLAAQEALRYQATHDPLSGLRNRGEILEILHRELSRSSREGTSLGVILADIDHFKKINDTFGHLVGDAVLKEIAHRMSSAVRVYDSVGRYGGEEFLIVVPSSDELGALSQAERVRSAVSDRPVGNSGDPISVTLSLGVVVGGSPPTAGSGIVLDPQKLLSAADAALYRAKKNGRNRTELAVAADLAAAPQTHEEMHLPAENV